MDKLKKLIVDKGPVIPLNFIPIWAKNTKILSVFLIFLICLELCIFNFFPRNFFQVFGRNFWGGFFGKNSYFTLDLTLLSRFCFNKEGGRKDKILDP